jgi:hypothetical protein
MGGDIVNPGDLHGRVLPADAVDLSWDGNLILALVGPDLVVGVSGFGDAVDDALRELADHLIEEAVWVEVTNREPIGTAKIRPCHSGTIQTNVVELYRIDEGRICAVVAQEDLFVGAFGIGESAHQALRHLADELVREGVWVEVTSQTEWHFVEEIPGANCFREEPKADDRPEGIGQTPTLQTCRGIPLGNGEYAGCPYGSAELRPLTGPCDCPACHGSGYEGVTATWVPHCDFGDPECPGFCTASFADNRATLSAMTAMLWCALCPLPT